MQEVGIVTKATNKEIIVRIERKSACGDNCSNCGLCNNNQLFISIENTINAKENDHVLLEMPSARVYKVAFLVYIIPLFVFIMGYYLADLILKSDIISIISGFLSMAIAFLVLYFYDKKKAQKYKPVAISLINYKEKS